MQELVGFKLIRLEDETVVESWGGAIGQCPSPPQAIFLPDNIQVFCPKIDTEYFGYKLTLWYVYIPDPIVEAIISSIDEPVTANTEDGISNTEPIVT